MPKTLINQNTSDDYTDRGGANINSVYESRGGWVTLAAQVYAQIQHSPQGAQQGQEQWSEEFVLPSGAHYLQPGLIGIRFRSFTTGVAVAVSAAVFFKDEPAMQLGGSGISSPTNTVASLNFQKNNVAVATEPTADFIDGTNFFTWTVVDDAPNTRVKITPVLGNLLRFPVSPSNVESLHGNGLTAGGDGINASWSITDNGNHEAFISIVPDAVGGWASFLTSVVGDANWRWYVDGSGIVEWGGGILGTDTFLRRTAAGVLRVDNTFVVGSGASSANGVGTLTVQDRVFSGTPSQGGIWVDGGSKQFMGSNSAALMGWFNNGWWLLVDQSGNLTLTGTYGFTSGAGVGGSSSVAGLALTLNKISGQVSYTGQSNTANVVKAFTVTNSLCTANSVVMVSMNNSTTAGGNFVCSVVPAAGGFTIMALSGTGNAGVTYSFNYWIMNTVIT